MSAISDVFKDHQCYLKSSIDPTEVLYGRPYGGIGFLCKKMKGVAYRPIECLSDRLYGLEIIVNKKVIACIFGVYLPCNDHSQGQMDLYLETLDQLQCKVDNIHESIPMIIVGDTNTVLPQMECLNPRWYKRRPSELSSCKFCKTAKSEFFLFQRFDKLIYRPYLYSTIHY